MKGRILIVLAMLLVAIPVAWANSPGPYPVIFIHGQKKEAIPDSGWVTWDDENDASAMVEILNEQYNGYTAGSPLNCHVNTNLASTGGDPLRIYNFSYYNPDASRGVIGNKYLLTETLYPVENDHGQREDYQTSVNNARWANNLAIFIDKVLAATSASKVNLVCHSMGGLVARDAINFYGCKTKVYKVTLVGSPNHGFSLDPLVEIVIEAFMNHPTWQKHGELLEMGLNTYIRNGGVRFYGSQSGEEKHMWAIWLRDADKDLSSRPLYQNIIGTLPRPLTVFFQPNDGVVPVLSAYLGYLRSPEKNRYYIRWHSREYHWPGYWDPEEWCLPTCDSVERRIKEWVFTYHTPPVITSVSWIKTSSALSAMSIIMWGQPRYKAQVYFTYEETPGWTFIKHKCWRRPSWRSWWSLHRVITNYNTRSYTGISNVKGGETWCFQVETVHNYQFGPLYYQESNQKCSTSPSSISPPSSGCPALYTFSEIDTSTGEYLFTLDNSLLAHSQVLFDTLSDYLVLSDSLPVLNGHYYLNISEDSTATSYFDEARLYAVDHPVTTGVATSADGITYVYSDLIQPNACYRYEMEILEDTAGNPVEYWYPYDLLDEVSTTDTLSIIGGNLDSIFVSFPSTGWTKTGLLMTTAPVSSSAMAPVKNYYYTVYKSVGDTSWSPIPGGQAFARHYPSDWMVDVSSPTFMSIEEDDGGVTFKIVCNANTIGYLNRIALVKLEPTGWSMREAPLDSAVHWEYQYGQAVGSNAYGGLRYADGIMAPYLEAGEQYALSFTALPDTSDTTVVRDFVLKTHGVYGYQTMSPSIDEHGALPEEYKFEIDQMVLSSQPISINYELPVAGRTTISVVDVTGRQVTVLVHVYHEAGSYSLTWDGKDLRGQRLPTGVYFIRMVSGSFTKSVKAVILN